MSAKAAADTLEELGDFTATPRLLPVGLIAVAIGLAASFVAKGLLALIDFFTNLFFFHRISIAHASPADHALGLAVVAVPVIGALVIGFMARYGSERIRGHGIPEAIEAILLHGSKVEPKVALLKPLSSAISIGSGGPFGAEGPIIMTGGAVGSLVAQFFHLTSAERKTLLVAGAAAGMAATFAAPVAATLLAVELLLFEWKPRSLVPVALASATAAAARRYILGLGPLFPVAPHPAFIGPDALAGCVVAGLLAGVLSGLLTRAVYASEDAFARLPIHWMWWPAIGGLVVGIGGLFFPRALGVGYDTIGDLLQGSVAGPVLLAILGVKALIWAVSLGSGTSGGVLAPLLMLGGALGGIEAWVLPDRGAGFWPLVSMGAILGGTMRAPLTGIVFSLELTHDVNMLLPLLVAVSIAHGFTVLLLKRSILTEKISRRGFHLSREYATDPLEILFVREVMRADVAALPPRLSFPELDRSLHVVPGSAPQRLFPVVDANGRLDGVVTRYELTVLADGPRTDAAVELEGILRADPVVAYPDEPLRVTVHRMATTGLTRFPVVERGPGRRLVGMVSLEDLLRARVYHLEAEHRRERIMQVRIAFPFGPWTKDEAS
ncbi:MAG TPA: chloride channel protein [Candidatus Eisenbacteria bacterium]|nr:chloride channel protein [Candidatus Eisenbacteria bacterium]